MKTLMIGSFALPALAHGNLTQQYTTPGGETLLRAASGRAIRQASPLSGKTRIVTSASGWVPSALQALDFDAQHLMRCIGPEAMMANGSRQATLPAGKYRTDADHQPWGLAQMADGNTVMTTATMAGDVATVAAVPGAVAYLVGYFPQFTVYLMRPTRSRFDWELQAEEV